MDSDRRAPFNLDTGRPDTNKRRHSQMEAGHRHSGSPLFVRRDSIPSEPHASPPHIHLPPIASHFPRDGFDYRRPITTMNPASTNNVIDLTFDDADDDNDDSAAPSFHHTPQPDTPPAHPRQRLPRYGREIIDLSVDTSPPPPRPRSDPPTDHPPPVQLSSPEVEFVSSRPLSRAEQRPNRLPPFLDQLPRRPVINLTAENEEEEEDDDLVTLGSRGGVNLLRPQGVTNATAALGTLARMVHEASRRGLRQTWAMRPQWPHHGHDDSGLLRLVGATGLPRPNYETVAFDLGTHDETPRLPTPKYSPPPPAPQGFTRNPTEEDTLVCPNCEDELAVGETEEKRQVWVVKACGHVYCGTCIQNRKNKRTKNSKGKARASDPILPEPFAFCRAADCGHTRVSHKADVMQIYF